MRINRRGALALLGLGGGASAATQAQAVKVAAVSYAHGVASGDPLQDRVVFWTRVTHAGPGGLQSFAGKLLVATNPELKGARSVAVTTGPDRDWTVKADVDGLKPGTDYWYAFEFDGFRSPVGRTRTLPDGKVEDVVLAVASCSLFPNGYFNAYGAIAALERVDAVLHLGDYIYEYGGPGSYGMTSKVSEKRPHDPPHECLSLADYRTRHAQYKTDPQLQAAHARAPWIVVWDDHETANDSWQGGAENHNPDKGEGDWAERKARALKAYFEWMPIRDPAPGGLPVAINRSFRFGDLARVVMVETRIGWRSEQLDYDVDLPIVDGKPDIPAFIAKWKDPSRQMMGPRQEQWLAGEMQQSVAAGEAWQVIGNQVVMARICAPNLPATMGPEAWGKLVAALPDYARKRVEQSAMMSAIDIPVNLDAWDGYPAARERVYDVFKAAKAHPIVLSGDSHSFWANELWDDGRKNRVAAEFGATGVTSPGFGDILVGAPLGEAFVQRNPEVKFSDSSAKGFVLLTLTREAVKGEMIAVSTILDPTFTASTIKTFTVAPTPGGGVGPLVAG